LSNISPNTVYDKSCSVKHKKTGKWYPLVRTSNKMAYYEDDNGEIKRMMFSSISSVSKEGEQECEVVSEKDTEVDPMFGYNLFEIASDPNLVNGNEEMFT